MAVAATQQIIANGPRNLVLKYTFAGTDGDAAAVKLVDVSAIDTGIGVNGLTLMSARYGCAGFSCELLWDATTDVSIITFPEDQSGAFDFSKFGGIKNNAAAANASGDVMYTTTGYTDAGGGGFLYLHFRKT